MKKSLLMKVSVGLFFVGLFSTVVVSSLAWFTVSKDASPTFNGSFVQYYFDQQSGDGYTAGTPLIISKPVHLYNLSRLYKKGIFSTSRTYTVNGESKTGIPTFYFQLGKANADGAYRFYSSSSDDETSNASASLSLTSLDMADYTSGNGLTVTPIGQDFGTDTDYSFKDHFVGHGLTISNLYVDATDTAYTHVGFFGDVKDGASITQFNFDGLTVDGTHSSVTAGADTIGLIAGYLSETAAQAITLKKIGVRDGVIKGTELTTSSYALIGAGNATAEDDLNNGFGGTGGDVGVCNITDVYNSAVAAYGEDGTSSAWTSNYSNILTKGSSLFNINSYKYIAGDKTKNDFGIFNVSSSTTNSQNYLLNTLTGFGDQSSQSKVKFKDCRAHDSEGNPTDTTVYETELGDDSSTGTIPDEFKKNIVDINGDQIISLPAAWCLGGVSSAGKTLTDNSGVTTTNYTSAFFFTTTKADQDVFYVAYRFYVYSGSATIKLINTSTTDGSSTQGPSIAYYGESVSNSGGLKGTIFKCEHPGNYAIITDNAGVSYSYIRVNGVSGGDFGDITTGGVAVDFIDKNATIATYDVMADNYSGAYYVITMTTAKSYIVYFKRLDDGTTKSVTAYYGTDGLTSSEIVAKGTTAHIASGDPPSS